MPLQDRKNDFEVSLLAPCHDFLLEPHSEHQPIPESITQLLGGGEAAAANMSTSNGMVLLVLELVDVLPRSLITKLVQLHRENVKIFQEPKLHLQSSLRIQPLATTGNNNMHGGVCLAVRDTRVSAALYEAIARHGFITLRCGKIKLLQQDLTTDAQMLTKFLAPKARMQMDDDVLKPTIAWIEARKAKLRAVVGGGGDGEGVAEMKAELEAILAATGGGGGGGGSRGGVRCLINSFIIPTVKNLSIYDADGEVSSFAASLWLLHQLDIFSSDLSAMMVHCNRYVRGVALFYARYVVAPEELPRYFLDANLPATVLEAGDDDDNNEEGEEKGGAKADVAELVLVNHDGRRGPLYDRTEVAWADDEDGTMHQLAIDLMTTDEVLEAWFPTYPGFAIDTIKAEVALRHQLIVAQAKTLKKAQQEGGGGAAATAQLETVGGVRRKKVSSGGSFLGFKDLTAMAQAFELASQMAKGGAVFEDISGAISTRSGAGDTEKRKNQQRRKRARDRQDALERGEFTVVADSVYLEF